jgi:hypothetical protein
MPSAVSFSPGLAAITLHCDTGDRACRLGTVEDLWRSLYTNGEEK